MKTFNAPKRARGFSLIEVLVAVVILTVGLLALASLQLSLIRSSSSTKAQSIAAGLAKDKIESLRAFTSLDGYRQLVGGTENLTDSGGDLGGVNYTRTWTVERYILNKATPAYVKLTTAQNTLTEAQIQALSPNYLTGKDFKRVTVTVTWADATNATVGGSNNTVAMEDIIDGLDPGESADLMSSTSGFSGPRKVEEKISDPALDAMVIPIAVGGGTESAASNPKPTVTQNSGADTVETRFDVLTYSGVNAGTANVQAKVETAMVGCKCSFDSPPASTVRGFRPTYWNGFRYAVPLFVDSTGAASYSPPGKVDTSVSGQSTLCGICCRDHFDPVGVKGATFSPRLVTKNSSDVVTASTHQHYLATSATTWNGPVNSGQYSEACRVIRVDGIWSVAADIENDYFNLLATQELSATKYYAQGFAPDSTAVTNYQNMVVNYLENRFVNSGTSQSNYNTLLTGGTVSTLETTNQINLPTSIGIDSTYTGTPSARSISAITRAIPGVVTTSTAHGFANDDRVLFANVGGMTALNGKSYIVANATSTTFQLKGLDTSAYTAFTSGGTATNTHAKWLHSRGMYVDYLEKDALSAIDAAKTACPSQSGSGYSNCVLTVLPFTSINLTELANWTTPDTTVVNVLKDNKYSDSTSQFEPISGKVTFVTGATTGATATITTSTRKANTGLLDLAQPSISSSDANLLTDTQGMVIGNVVAAGGSAGSFWVSHALAKPASMGISASVNGGPSAPCNYVVASTIWQCKPAGDKALWSGIVNAVSITVSGYNYETIGAAVAAPSVGGCTYAGGSGGTWPVKAYTTGGGVTYNPHKCFNYDIANPATNSTIPENSGTPVVSNSGALLESTTIPFVHVNADPDELTLPNTDNLVINFGSPTPSAGTDGTLSCTYTCGQEQSNDCKSNKPTNFAIASKCN